METIGMMKATDRLLGEGIAKLLRCWFGAWIRGRWGFSGAQNYPKPNPKPEFWGVDRLEDQPQRSQGSSGGGWGSRVQSIGGKA